MMSSDSFSGTATRMSACENATRARSALALSRATARAAGEMSIALTCGHFIAMASDMAMHPLPVPMSSTRKSGAVFSPAIISTSCSVSGRGMRVSGVTLNVCPAKRASPKMCCIGSLRSSRATASSMRAEANSGTSLSSRIIISTRE